MNIKISDGALLINDNKVPLSNYEVLEKIGEGKNARVFSVHNKVLDRQEALKVWIPRKNYRKVDEKRFYSELQKNALFTGNSAIATIYTGGHWKDIYYCLLEYCPGVTLKEFLKPDTSWFHRWGLAREISDTLRDIYGKGVYHGDLHNRNIIINTNSNDWLKILDLGTSIYSGHKCSHKRDAQMLFNLSFELLPCLRDLAFYNNKAIAQLPSPLINRAFRAVINISIPKIPPNQDPFDCPKHLYAPPDYHKLNILKLVLMIKETPLFSLELIDQFLYDFCFETDEKIKFYKELNTKIAGDTSVNDSEIIAIAAKKYEHLFKKYMENFERC